MKATLRYLLVIVLVAAFALTACRLAQRDQPAQPSAGAVPEIGIPGVSGVVLFQDDFQDGQIDPWTVNAAWNVEQSGDLYYFGASSAGGAWLPQGTAWRDYLFRAAVRLETGSLMLSFDLTQAGRYLLHLRSDGVYLLKEQPAGNFTLLAHSGPVTLGTSHAVGVANQGGHLQVYVDKDLWMDFTDPAPITQGTIGVSTLDGSRALVDNVLVIQLTAPLPVSVVQAPPPQVSAPSVADVAPEEGAELPIAEVQAEEVEEPEEAAPEPGGQPDLQIAHVGFVPDSPTQGQPMTVAVTIYNGGNAGAGAFNVRWYPEGANFVGCSWDIFSLPAGESVDMVCDYPGYPNAGAFNWGVSADADNEVAESDEGNNRQDGDMLVQAAVIQEPPPAPTNCTVIAVTSTEITIGWDFPGDESAIEGFSIYQGVTSVEGWTSSGVRDFMITDLMPGVQYHFDVRTYAGDLVSDADVCFVDATTNP